MADPVVLLTERVGRTLADLAGDGSEPDPVIRPSQHADLQVNGVLGLAKRLGRNPREMADELVGRLDVDDLCAEVTVAGPGFVNLTLRDDALAGLLADLAGPTAGVRTPASTETVVIDYSAPNVAKEMHVGHLRSTVIGDSLARTFAFLGHDVIRQNHLGDWGTPFGMLVEHLVDEGETGQDTSIGDLNAFYRAARAKFDTDETFADRARRRVVALQAGDGESLALWQILVRESTRYFTGIYDRLGTTLTDDDYAGESSYNPVLDDVVAELGAKGLLVTDDGAECVFPPGFTGRDDEPLPLIVRKSDGGYGYAATDLAALRHRTRDLGATRLLYVVGSPQHEHLEMVFEVGRMAGWLEPPAHAEHIGFGSVLGEDGKILRTRAGETIRLADLLDEAIRRADELVADKSPHLDPAERATVARAIGMGAVKYADLSSDRIKDYVFAWDRMLALTGNTGPYLQYAHARMRSILRKAADDDRAAATADAVMITEAAEHDLALALLGFDAAVHAAAERCAPHRLCTYLFELATTYTTFYETCPVLRTEDVALRRSRLALCALTADVLACGLGLLGIEAPERI